MEVYNIFRKHCARPIDELPYSSFAPEKRNGHVTYFCMEMIIGTDPQVIPMATQKCFIDFMTEILDSDIQVRDPELIMIYIRLCLSMFNYLHPRLLDLVNRIRGSIDSIQYWHIYDVEMIEQLPFEFHSRMMEGGVHLLPAHNGYDSDPYIMAKSDEIPEQYFTPDTLIIGHIFSGSSQASKALIKNMICTIDYKLQTHVLLQIAALGFEHVSGDFIMCRNCLILMENRYEDEIENVLSAKGDFEYWYYRTLMVMSPHDDSLIGNRTINRSVMDEVNNMIDQEISRRSMKRP